MTKSNWYGLLKVKEIGLISATGELLWKEENLHNILHQDGEKYIIKALFAGEPIPTNYYFGLDNRSSLNLSDDMGSISQEPTINGYSRQGISSTTQFSISTSAPYTATSPIIFFSANGGSWGPVANLFMTNKSDNSGYLISSVALSQPNVTVENGTSIYVQMALQLSDNS